MRTLAAAGVVLSQGLFQSLVAAYQREAEDAVADSYGVAMINGLTYDRHEEEIEVQTFAAALRASIEEFQADPSGPPLVPNWARVWAGVHDAGPRLLAAVAAGPT
jgi:glucosyl-3-phosphoglycerate synthase